MLDSEVNTSAEILPTITYRYSRSNKATFDKRFIQLPLVDPGFASLEVPKRTWDNHRFEDKTLLIQGTPSLQRNI